MIMGKLGISLDQCISFQEEDYDSIVWKDDPKCTKKEWEDAKIDLAQEYDANQYQRDRQYPSIGDQLDMQYHDQLDGTTTWKDAIAKVKSDNPKE